MKPMIVDSIKKSLVLALLLALAACGGLSGNAQETLTTQAKTIPPSATLTLAPILLVPPARPEPAATLLETPQATPSAANIPPTGIPALPTSSELVITSAPFNRVVPTATSIPTQKTPTPQLHPLAIKAMRAGAYPGSEIVIEGELTPGANYKRYYASYLSEGLKIYGLLTIPDGEKPASGWPVIVFNHGYIPPDEYRTTERYVAYLDTLARNGYILFRPDYRGHDNSEGLARGAYGYPDYVVDVLNAVASIKRLPEADPNHIGMWGHSMGGYITLRIMVITKDVKVGVIWAGVVASYPDMLTKWIQGPGAEPVPPEYASSWQDLTQVYGTPEENPQFWASISANSFLADISGPLQLHHGTADIEVPVEFSETLYAQLVAANKTAELYTYEQDNHNLSNYFNQAMRRTVEFFDRYLKKP
ncbi:MAG TPA: alpha/beta fold hydrolase [Anaerolineales bacterium]|jgi:fermentation-respiration switch protein FrsA (DUF1100 family)